MRSCKVIVHWPDNFGRKNLTRQATRWPAELLEGPVQVVYDRCRCGLKVLYGPHRGKHLKKPSTMTASHPTLLHRFINMKCTGRHEHLALDGVPRETQDAQLWTWDEAQRIVEGIMALMTQMSVTKGAFSYAFPVGRRNPTIDTSQVARAQPGGQPGPDPNAPPRRDCIECPSCRNLGRRIDDWEHTRVIGKCKYPYDDPFIPTCQACIMRLNRRVSGDVQHTLADGCVHAIAPERAYAPRRGHHPRDPARPAEDDPTAGMEGTSGGTELGQEGEETLDRQASGRSIPEAGRLDEDGIPEGHGSSSSASGSGISANRRPRGLDQQPRHRSEQIRTTDTATGENPADWTRFDIARVLRTLRMGSVPQVRMTLRKLHIRWYHAPAAAMTRLLDRAGVPKQILDMILPIVQTCRACRAWAKPAPLNVATIDLPDSFNQSVECDIMFYKKYKIFHLVCRCTRWYHAVVITDREDDTLIYAIDTWVRIHGPMQELISDAETGLAVSEKTQQYLDRKGIRYKPRAKGQHIATIDRRGALVRDIIHKIVEQLTDEGIQMPFEHVVSDATFASNALLSINGCTPYNAVYGRVPNILPDINQLDAENESGLSNPGTIRHAHRLREITVRHMVEATAQLRAERALGTRSLPAGQAADYRVGEEVDVYRPQGTKDISGWLGPARITSIDNIASGSIGVKYLGRPFDARLGDVRRHIALFVFLAAASSAFGSYQQIWLDLQQHTEKLSAGATLTLGTIFTPQGSWTTTRDTEKHAQFFYQAVFFATVCIGWKPTCVRCGVACKALQEAAGNILQCVTLWWQPGSTEIQRHYGNSVSSSLSFAQVDPHWHTARFIQFLMQGVPDEEEEPRSRAEEQRPAAEARPTTEPLPSIPEEPEEEELENELSLWVHEDGLQPELLEAQQCCLQYGDDLPTRDNVGRSIPKDGPGDDVPWHHEPAYYLSHLFGDQETATHNNSYHIVAANQRADLPPNYDLDTEEDFIELCYEGHAHKLAYQNDQPTVVLPGEGEHLCAQIYKASTSKHKPGDKKVVVDRDDALLTKEEVQQHWAEVCSAIQKELETWVKHRCISRKRKAGAKNIIDVRWVFKWKFEHETQTASASLTSNTVKRRIIRARLCLRGFKDIQANDLDSYAGTSQRYSQRVIVSEAVIREWDLANSDISKAFLQGVTYEELARITGEPLREVNFYLPGYCIPFLRKIPGYEDFDPVTEVLHCDKPGTGCNDAPRCFSLKLAKVTHDLCGMVACTVDKELCFLHCPETGRLKAILAKHVDDLKICSDKQTIVWIIEQIEKVFGKLKIEWNNFTNCGIRHVQDVKTKETSLDQIEYIKGVRVIAHPDMVGSPDSWCTTKLHHEFWSVLGALAFATITRADILVFVSALQRHSHQPKIIHVKRLNVVVRWAQRNPCQIWYRKLDTQVRPMGSTIPTHLRLSLIHI